MRSPPSYHVGVMTVTDRPAATRPTVVGAVSFLNTLPLIDGLGDLANVDLRYTVPSLLVDQLLARDVDLALVSSIDYQRAADPLVIVPVGMLGCCGPTLTVRMYATCPVEQITTVHCDTDSHTSVALLRMLLRERYDLDPAIVDYNAREHVADHKPLEWPEAMLLIGDKVVTDSPPAVRYPTQLDLGDLWFQHTQHPFVFATWMARGDDDRPALRTAARILDHQRRHNVERLDRIVHERAVPRGWPADLARTYLKQRLIFDFTPEARAGLELFYAKAQEHGLIETRREITTMDT